MSFIVEGWAGKQLFSISHCPVSITHYNSQWEKRIKSRDNVRQYKEWYLTDLGDGSDEVPQKLHLFRLCTALVIETCSANQKDARPFLIYIVLTKPSALKRFLFSLVPIFKYYNYLGRMETS